MDETQNLGLLSTSAVVMDVGRDLVVATGADRVRLLQGIITADVAGTPVGSGCHATLLSTKAHIVAEMRVFPRELDLYLAVPRGEGGSPRRRCRSTPSWMTSPRPSVPTSP